MPNRILWNQRPAHDYPSGGGGDIDEIVMHDVKMVHIEQMDVRCWWIALYTDEGEGPYWMGNFTSDSGRMRFVEQENNGVVWDRDDCHEDVARKVDDA